MAANCKLLQRSVRDRADTPIVIPPTPDDTLRSRKSELNSRHATVGALRQVLDLADMYVNGTRGRTPPRRIGRSDGPRAWNWARQIPSLLRMGMEVDLSCPRCGERVLETGGYGVGRHHARHQRATCPQCHIELVRHPDLKDSTWKVQKSAPLPDEELGGSG